MSRGGSRPDQMNIPGRPAEFALPAVDCAFTLTVLLAALLGGLAVDVLLTLRPFSRHRPSHMGSLLMSAPLGGIRARTAASIRSATPSTSASTSCSHTRRTSEPSRLRRAKLLRSRWRFRSIFASQYGESLCCQAGNRRPCQKSPSTNTTTRAPLKTISGVPGRLRTCLRKRRPRACTALRTAISIPVSLLRTLVIARRRCSGVRLSGIRHAPHVRTEYGGLRTPRASTFGMNRLNRTPTSPSEQTMRTISEEPSPTPGPAAYQQRAARAHREDRNREPAPERRPHLARANRGSATR